MTIKVVAVHAHPDDEAVWTGGLLALFAAAGAQVTVITATLGEAGEVIGPFQDLVASKKDTLGQFRQGELRGSLAALNVAGQPLGQVGQFRDSGMADDVSAARPNTFVAQRAQAALALETQLARLQPDVVITYAADGGYGHPDHILCHELVSACSYQAPVVLYPRTDRADYLQALALLDGKQLPGNWRRADHELALHDEAQLAVPLTPAAYNARLEAMAAHATQVWVGDGRTSATNPAAAQLTATSATGQEIVFWAFSNDIVQPATWTEWYQLGPEVDPAAVKQVFAELGVTASWL